MKGFVEILTCGHRNNEALSDCGSVRSPSPIGVSVDGISVIDEFSHSASIINQDKDEWTITQKPPNPT